MKPPGLLALFSIVFTCTAYCQTGISFPKYGKYGCSASKLVNGFYEFLPKGSFVLAKNGSYSYNGFVKPSAGTFTVNKSGVIRFKDGYFNGGEATPMKDRANRFYLVFPSNPDNRWTCSYTGEK